MNTLQDTENSPIPNGKTEDFEVGINTTSPGEMLADSAMGILNNLLAVGGGWFISIKKHEDFYELDEFVKVVDEQNEKNVGRLLLDEEDKAMLRPLLALMLSKHVEKIGPEQQFMAVAFTILMKKIKLAMTIRKENQIMEKRLLDIIQNNNKPAPAPLQVETPPTPPEPGPDPIQELGLAESPAIEEPIPTSLEKETPMLDPLGVEEQDEFESAVIPALPSLVEASTTSVPKEAPAIWPEVAQADFSPEPSNFETRIANAFEAMGKQAEAGENTLFLRLALKGKDINGLWFKAGFPYKEVNLKTILKMIFGGSTGLIPGIGTLAKTKLKGFFAAKAEQYGVESADLRVFLAYHPQGRLRAKILGKDQVHEALTINQLVEQFQNGGLAKVA